jgi:hypothetical protein
VYQLWIIEKIEMKSLSIKVIGLGLLMASCQNTAKNSDQEDEKPGVIDEKKVNDERLLIVPGKSIGEIYLGQSVEDLGKILGPADAGDAAMGKAWGVWYDRATGDKIEQFAVYSAYVDTSMVAKDVKQIRTASAKYQTQEGVGVSKGMAEILKVFPAIKLVQRYVDTLKNDTINVYEDNTKGLSLEFIKGQCSAVSVYPAKKASSSTYLSLHPEWKLLE